MILPKAADAIHKAWMYKLLMAIADETLLATSIFFKGETCASMRGFIDRFSVDLDFDLPEAKKINEVKLKLENVFDRLELKIHDKSANYPQYFLKYDNKPGERNTLKFDVNFPVPKNNDYEAIRLIEIDRIIKCQTVETMFANKLIAAKDRYEKNGSVAGRDLFDIHSFILRGYEFKKEIIEEVSGKQTEQYLKELKEFIRKYFTRKNIDEDLNHLLPPDKFRKIRKTLKQEVLAFL